MEEQGTQKQKHVWTGKVVSAKMQKTVVVETSRVYRHPLFRKVLKCTKKYKVHDEQGMAKVGDRVEFYEGRPVSKTKYMYLLRVVDTHS